MKQWVGANKEKHAAGTAKWRKNNVERKKASDQQRYYDRMALYNKLKEGPCTDCKQTFPTVCMDFDHVSGVKAANVGRLANQAVSIEKILEEIKKCELVCSNCHRIRTFITRRN
jgi:hypothetical protein